jgi:hypothetical protein
MMLFGHEEVSLFKSAIISVIKKHKGSFAPTPGEVQAEIDGIQSERNAQLKRLSQDAEATERERNLEVAYEKMMRDKGFIKRRWKDAYGHSLYRWERAPMLTDMSNPRPKTGTDQ